MIGQYSFEFSSDLLGCDFSIIILYINNLYIASFVMILSETKNEKRSFKLSDFSPAVLFADHGWSSLSRHEYNFPGSIVHEKAKNQFQPYFFTQKHKYEK